MGDIPIEAFDMIAIPNEMKHVPTSNAVILFAMIIISFILSGNLRQLVQQTKERLSRFGSVSLS
jgi:hypothetical protein